MSSIVFKTGTPGPRAGDRMARGGIRDRSARGMGATGSSDEASRRRGGADVMRLVAAEITAYPALLAGAIVLYVALVAPPLLALLTVVAMGLLMSVIGALFGGMS